MPCYKSVIAPEGVTFHPLYEVYRSMLSRCYRPEDPDFKYYGARNIRVSLRWRLPKGKGFQNFVFDMGPRPEGRTSAGIAAFWLDRKDNDGDYTPTNCRWADTATQHANRRKR